MISRRRFVQQSALFLASTRQSFSAQSGPPDDRNWHERSFQPISHSVIPIVGDGKWIWREPPKGETGYLEPREFEVTTGMLLEGKGDATQIMASTVAPIQFPEQEIVEFKIQTRGCQAKIVPRSQSAAQLVMAAPRISKGQNISAVAKYRLRLFKDYRAYSKESFPKKQTEANHKKNTRSYENQFSFSPYLKASPGINLRSSALKKVVRSLTDDSLHPWDQARAFYDWVWTNIKGVPGRYTSVEEAIKNGKGDCEERASVFIALCRSVGIPARLVWVPSHNWAEIGLYDHDRNPHWIPIHTSAYSWFGWTGAHEVILQKGDRVTVPERKKPLRLIDDWYRLNGKSPAVVFSTKIQPVAKKGNVVGPGAREKLRDGRWKLIDNPNGNTVRLG